MSSPDSVLRLRANLATPAVPVTGREELSATQAPADRPLQAPPHSALDRFYEQSTI